MKKYALYPGCVMPTEQFALEKSIREVLPVLDIELVDLKGFSCCGEPIKSVNQMLTLTLSARNLAIAEKEGLDVLTPCPMCHLALSDCKRILDTNRDMYNRINKFLEDEGLKYTGTANIVHTVELLHNIVGLDKIKEKVKKPLKELKTATHYGCHLFRPSEVGRPVDSENPREAFQEAVKTFGKEFVSAFFYAKEIKGYVGHLEKPDRLTLTSEGLKMVQEYRKEMQQLNFNKFVAFTGLALSANT